MKQISKIISTRWTKLPLLRPRLYDPLRAAKTPKQACLAQVMDDETPLFV